MDDDWKRQLDRLHEGLVRRDDPAEWVTEADAVRASRRYPHLMLRGPVFGLAAQDPGPSAPWRLVRSVTNGTPQEVRDGLNSLLWFRARDDTDDPAERRELLAAVALLEREPVDELTVLGGRYRVVRGEEFARVGESGPEPPRPTDPEPADPSWEEHRRDAPVPDPGFALTPGREDGLMAGAMKLALRDLVYTGAHFPKEMRADSTRALTSHPEVVLLPVGFGVVEHDGRGWRPRGALRASPHDARQQLFGGLTESWPLLYGFDDRERARYARAAAEFRAAGRADELRVDDELFRICRVERMVRCGPDGPEPPRPSDADHYGPTKMHPRMDEDGTVHHGE
ncbi:hypothetical protein Stsp01_52430 [Streptomyces sp. NBRC 13847]|uniref:DUF5954 family protein n=1 Tax=Streptomyces TaxID=1883 RepID=UPI0024A278A0|nr:DUF5954 family protein [Streptomyces sp. NBRC 13847]GLW18500.1 hypothetical protein Stsp01_52430 [Streptomyces sp. NBRC 13847]